MLQYVLFLFKKGAKKLASKHFYVYSWTLTKL